jgi:phenylalanyl-tRNA synthetase beta chain
MKISFNWLRDYIKTNIESEKVAEILTNIGLEVEGIETYEEVKGGLRGLVVGEVLTCFKHPNTDKYSLTTVNIGSGVPLNIVCGAPNVAVGQKVIVATVGTEMQIGDKSFTISNTKIRGEKSEGMICAEDEIGLGTSHDGIIEIDPSAVPGTSAAKYFNIVSDTIFEIGLTPNRIDAASHYGAARDLAAYLSQQSSIELRKPDISDFRSDDDSLKVNISIEDTVGCPRFTGVTISDVVIAPSPRWLQNRLRAIGLSPINNVVDVTNYVLHELGQPLHAYDADKLHGKKIIVKRLTEGTQFQTLDAIYRKLSNQDVMVCDIIEPLCIAGVLGGLKSGVTNSTKNIFLESAYFDPKAVRRTARRHGLNTDSSFRFERGVDPQNTIFALKRAAVLIKEVAGGRISSEVVDVHPKPVNPLKVDILYSHVDRLIGKKLDRGVIRKILHSLDFRVLFENTENLKIEIPPYRVDVISEADVIEEILRIYGYNNIEFAEKLNASISYVQRPDNEHLVNTISNYLADNGFNEIMSNSLTKEEYYTKLNSFPVAKLVNIINPLSTDVNVMRQTLLYGGLEAISRNVSHKNFDLRLFEYGRVYSLIGKDKSKFESYKEVPVFGLFITGKKEDQSWAVMESPSSFFQIKAYYINMLKKVGIDISILTVRPLESYNDVFAGGLEYFLDNESVIRAGIVNSKHTEIFDIENEVYFAEIYWDLLLTLAGSKEAFVELPKYPLVRRDLALLLEDSIEFSQIEKLAFESERKLLKNIKLFDYYKGKNIPIGKKSYAVSFFIQDLNKTLTDKKIDRIMTKITDNLIKNLRAELR